MALKLRQPVDPYARGSGQAGAQPAISLQDPHPPIAVSVNEAVRITGLGRSLLYELMKQHELAFVHIRNRRLLIVDDLADLLRRHRESR
jgi:hypothetical protein